MRLNGRLQAEILLLQVVEFDRERLNLVLHALQFDGRLHNLLLLLCDVLAHDVDKLPVRAARSGSLKKERELDNQLQAGQRLPPREKERERETHTAQVYIPGLL